jgi:hypothetical protein
MAQQVLVQLVDDLDGTAGGDIETIRFSLDGVSYEIDLGPKNGAQLRDALADFVTNARRVGGRAKRDTAASSAAPSRSKEETAAIRDWAKKNGHELVDRGRIPAHVIAAYEAAH